MKSDTVTLRPDTVIHTLWLLQCVTLFQVRDEVSRGLFAISVAAAVAGGEEGKDAATDQAAAFFLRLLHGALLGLRDGAAPEGVAVVFDVSLGATAAGAAAGAGVQIVPLGDALVVTRGGTAISVGVA